MKNKKIDKDERVHKFLFRFYRNVNKIESDYILNKNADDFYPTKWLPADHPYLNHIKNIRAKQYDLVDALEMIKPFCYEYKFANIPHELFYQNYSTFDFSKVDPSVKELVKKAFDTGRLVGKIEIHNFFICGLRKALNIRILENNKNINSFFGRIFRFFLLPGIIKTLQVSKKYLLLLAANTIEINNCVKELVEFANNKAQKINNQANNA